MKNYDCRFVLGSQRLGVVLQLLVALPDTDRPSKARLVEAARTQLRAAWHDSPHLDLSVNSSGPLRNFTAIVTWTSLTEDNLVEWHPAK